MGATSTRPPAVAGSFYPGTRAEVESQSRVLLARAERVLDGLTPRPHPKALVVPHAGWRYAGDLAALGWQTLAPERGAITRVVVLGPTHRVAIRGVALPGSDFFATPLGTLPIPSAEVLELTAGLPTPVTVDAETHAEEHAIEVQVPFIQAVLGDVELVPLNAGAIDTDDLADVIEALWGGPGTVVAVSSDLSHYLDDTTARALDDDTIARILALEPVDHERACGATPLDGLLEVCRRRGLTPRLLGTHTSGDVAGDHDRVVGYATFSIDEEA